MVNPDGYISYPHIPLDKDFDDPEVRRALKNFWEKIADRLTKISFIPPEGTIATDSKPLNLDAIWVAYVSNGSADTEDAVSHGLGRIPVGFIPGIPDKSAIVYRTGTAPTSTLIYLAASATSVTVNVLLF